MEKQISKLKYPLVIIEWKDAMYLKDGWSNIEKDISEPATCISVGFLVNDSPNAKTLYSSIALEDDRTNECGRGNIIIPTKHIVLMKTLSK